MKNITILGATGFVGRALVRRLAATGAQIRVPCRNPDKALFLKTMGAVGQITPYRADIRRPETLNAALNGADAAINCVGILYEKGRNRFPALHADLPAQLGQAAAAQGVKKLVHLSALGADATSASRYARSKAEGERRLHAALPGASILRPSVIFGPDDNFFNLFAELSLYAPALPLIGGGHTRFQPVYVEDVAHAACAALSQTDAAGKIYELGGPATYSFKQLLTFLMEQTGRQRALIPLPFPLAMLQAACLELLPRPLLTQDQVRLLRTDNVLTGSKPGLEALGITPTALEAIVPLYLDRYRVGGRFAPKERAA